MREPESSSSISSFARKLDRVDGAAFLQGGARPRSRALRWGLLTPLTLCVLLAGGCSDGDSGNGSGGAPDPDEHPHQACVDRINELRATLSLPPLERWTEAEACSDQQSDEDQSGGGAHGNFGACEEFGQNTCPDWPSPDAVLGGCLDAMWAEGPPPSGACDGACFQAHGHYLNMTSTAFTKVACGFHDDGQGGVWSNQNFK